jgi:hypothetical protein
MSSPVNISGGSFQDSEGNLLSGGYLTFELNQEGVVNTSTVVCAGRVITVPLDSFGNVFYTSIPPHTGNTFMWANDELPAGSFYMVSAFTASGIRVWGPNPQRILSTPAPFDLGAWVPGSV